MTPEAKSSEVVGVPDKNYVFLFPHQDDELGVIHDLEIASKSHDVAAWCVFLTDGGRKGPKRNVESRRVLQALGVKSERILFKGAELDVIDGNAADRIGELAKFTKQLVEELRPHRMYFPAWEGGHQDHDAIHVAAHLACDRAGYSGERLVFPLYSAANNPMIMFSFGNPPINCGNIHRRQIGVLCGFRYFLTLARYPSQWSSLIPLAPFLFVAWILRRRFFVGVSDGMPDLQKPPHSGKLLYEKRKKYEWKVLARKAIEASR